MLLLGKGLFRFGPILHNSTNGGSGQTEKLSGLSEILSTRHVLDDVHLLRDIQSDSRLALFQLSHSHRLFIGVLGIAENEESVRVKD